MTDIQQFYLIIILLQCISIKYLLSNIFDFILIEMTSTERLPWEIFHILMFKKSVIIQEGRMLRYFRQHIGFIYYH